MKKHFQLGLFYFRHICLMSVKNKIRIALTSAGIFVAVAVLATGMILSDSYYGKKLRTVDEMAENVVIVSAIEDAEEIRETLAKVTDAQPVEDVCMSQNMPLLQKSLSANTTLMVSGEFHGMSETGKTVAVRNENDIYLPVDSVLISGRHLTRQDVSSGAEVLLIDEFTAELLFPDEDAVGKTVVFGQSAAVYDPDAEGWVTLTKSATVVGVVRNSEYSKERRRKLTRELAQLQKMQESGIADSAEQQLIRVDVAVYCPSSTLCMWYPEETTGCRRRFLYSYGSGQEYRDACKRMEFVATLKGKSGVPYEIQTKEEVRAYYELLFSNTRRILNLVTVILCAISGISIMNIMFFSVKERVPEIGIRKAFGAGRGDILFQLVFEAAVTAFVVSVLAVCFSYYGCMLARGLLSEKMLAAFEIRVENAHLIFPMFVGVFEAVVSTVPPAIYAARIRVTEALRFE